MANFINDNEKMADFKKMTKDEFLKSYRYLTEEDYNETIKNRLEYLKKQIENENIGYGEIAELESLKDYIDKNDVLLLQWAGVPETI